MGILKTYFYNFQLENPYILILLLIFLTVTFLSFALFLLLRKTVTPADRLQKLNAGISSEFREPPPSLLEHKESSFLGKLFSKIDPPEETSPGNEIDPKMLRLIQAGLRSHKAYQNYIHSKMLCAIALPVAYLIFTPTYTFDLRTNSICLAAFLAGYLLPDLFILHRRKRRQEAIRKGLPDALDLMIICVTAGLGLDMTFSRVGTELQDLWRDLSDEFNLTNLEIRAGKARSESYNNLARRTGVVEVKSLMNMLNQTNRFGTSVSDALRVYASSMRIKRRQLAEERAAKTPVKITIPLVCCILPALFVVLIGPGGIRILRNLLPALSAAGAQ